ncbi:MAG: TolC family protein, partial [Candidatus Cloacimonadota bacterium]|nr:TolC family protein [Candidatus Cloacimonadota bacterium]
MVKNLISTLILVIFTFSLASKSLTLNETIEIAKENNKELQKAKEEVEKYRQEYREVRGGLLPQLKLTGGYQFQKTKMPESALIDYQSASSMLDTTATFNDNILADYIDNAYNVILPSEEQKEYSLSGGLELSQVVFMGGKLINGINIAGKLYHLQEKKYEIIEQDIILTTKEKFYQTILAQKVYDIQVSALEFAQEYYDQVSAMYQEGLVSEYDKLRAELEVKKLQPEVLEAKKNYKIAYQDFQNYLDIRNNFELEGEIELPKDVELTLQQALEEGLEARTELELSDLSVEVQRVNLRYEKGNFLPNIAINADYNRFAQYEKNLESNDWGSSYSVGIGFSMPLFTGFSNKAKIAKARHTLKQAKLDRQDTQEKIELDIRNSYLQWQADMEKVDA